jgi:hypothetical protein
MVWCPWWFDGHLPDQGLLYSRVTKAWRLARVIVGSYQWRSPSLSSSKRTPSQGPSNMAQCPLFSVGECASLTRQTSRMHRRVGHY